MLRPQYKVRIVHKSGETVVMDDHTWSGRGRWSWHKMTRDAMRLLKARLFAKNQGIEPPQEFPAKFVYRCDRPCEPPAYFPGTMDFYELDMQKRIVK